MIKLPKYAIIVVIKGVFIMEVINLSSRSFKGLRTLELPNIVYNTEGKIYVYEDKDKWNKRMHLVKRLLLIVVLYLVISLLL